MNPADAVMRWLGDQGHSPLFLDAMPAEPDVAAMIVATGGTDVAGVAHGWTAPTVQLLVRGTSDPRESASWCQAMADQLAALEAEQLSDSQGGTGRVAGVEMAQPHPVRVGRDDNGRHRHSVNATLQLDR